MYSHLKSDIYHLKSRISFPAFAESRPLTAFFAANIAAATPPSAAAKPSSLLSLGVCAQPPCGMAVQMPLHFVFTQHSVLSTFPLRLAPSLPLHNAQTAIAAAMTEPTASLGGSSRASRMAVALFQRLLPSFPPAIAAALLQIDLMSSTYDVCIKNHK